MTNIQKVSDIELSELRSKLLPKTMISSDERDTLESE